MATPLQLGDAPIGSEVALPPESDVRRPTKRGEAKTKSAHDEPG